MSDFDFNWPPPQRGSTDGQQVPIPVVPFKEAVDHKAARFKAEVQNIVAASPPQPAVQPPSFDPTEDLVYDCNARTVTPEKFLLLNSKDRDELEEYILKAFAMGFRDASDIAQTVKSLYASLRYLMPSKALSQQITGNRRNKKRISRYRLKIGDLLKEAFPIASPAVRIKEFQRLNTSITKYRKGLRHDNVRLAMIQFSILRMISYETERLEPERLKKSYPKPEQPAEPDSSEEDADVVAAGAPTRIPKGVARGIEKRLADRRREAPPAD